MKINSSPLTNPDHQAEYCHRLFKQCSEAMREARRKLKPLGKDVHEVRSILAQALTWSDGAIIELDRLIQTIQTAKVRRAIEKGNDER